MSAVAVIGGTGFLGREVVRLVPGASVRRADVRDATAVSELLSAARPGV